MNIKEIEDLKNQAIKKGSYKALKINVLELIRDMTRFDRKDFCYDINILNFQNGMYHIETDKFYPIDEEVKEKYKFFYAIWNY